MRATIRGLAHEVNAREVTGVSLGGNAVSDRRAALYTGRKIDALIRKGSQVERGLLLRSRMRHGADVESASRVYL